MVIAEQNLSLLEGKVTRLLGLHAGKLKGGAMTQIHGADAAPAAPPLRRHGDRGGMDPYYLALTTVTLASIYGLLALGISIIWSSLGMINMAQGFTFAVSGYGAWLVAQNISQQRHCGRCRRACSPVRSRGR